MNRNTPKGAHYYLDGIYYRIGLRGMAFLWAGSEWVRSTRSASEIRGGTDINATHAHTIRRELIGKVVAEEMTDGH